MAIEEGYYLAIYKRSKVNIPEVVKVFRSYGEGESAVFLALRHGYARSYRLDYFEFQTRCEIPIK